VSGSGRFSRGVTVTDDASNLLRVTVSVTPAGATQAISLVTLFYKRTSP
jgi:hypothetical protein